MLTLALTLLSSTQGVYQPETVRHFDAQEQVRAARLTKDAQVVGTGVLLAQAEVAPPAPGGVAPAAPPAKSLQELRDEYRRLEESRPGIGGKIAMLAIGGVLDIAGISFLLYGITYFGLVNAGAGFIGTILGVVFVVIAVICLAVGIPLTIVGAVGLGKNLKERREIGEQMEAIDAQIKQLEAAPPPPPPPSSVENLEKTFQKVPMQTVLVF